MPISGCSSLMTPSDTELQGAQHKWNMLPVMSSRWWFSEASPCPVSTEHIVFITTPSRSNCHTRHLCPQWNQPHHRLNLQPARLHNGINEGISTYFTHWSNGSNRKRSFLQGKRHARAWVAWSLTSGVSSWGNPSSSCWRNLPTRCWRGWLIGATFQCLLG